MRNQQALRLHQTVQESRQVNQGQGEGQDVQINPLPGPGRTARRREQVPGGVGELLPARGVQDDLQCGRLLRMGPTHALDTRQTRRQNRLSMTELGRRFCNQGWRFAYNGSFHRRLRRRNDPLPLLLPRQHHTDPMDHQTGSCRHRQLTNGQTRGAPGAVRAARTGRKANPAPRPA
jgi:hypothetical protein